MKLIPTLILCITFGGLYHLNYKKRRIGFLFFGTSALCWSAWNIYIGEYQQAVQQGLSGVFTFWTFWHWGRK